MKAVSGIGARLTKLRMMSGLTMKAVATRLRVSCSTVMYWEQELHDISGAKLLAIADFFGVTTDYLLGRCDFRWRVPVPVFGFRIVFNKK